MSGQSVEFDANAGQTADAYRFYPAPATRGRKNSYRRQIAAAGLADGKVRPLIDNVFALGAAGDKRRLIESSGHIGKIVLVMPAFTS